MQLFSKIPFTGRKRAQKTCLPNAAHIPPTSSGQTANALEFSLRSEQNLLQHISFTKLIQTNANYLKTFLFATIILLIAQNITAQNKSWTIGTEKGYAQIQGEVKSADGLGIGLYAIKPIYPYFAAKLQIGMGKMRGLDQKPSNNWQNHPSWNGTINSAINYTVRSYDSIYANYQTDFAEVSLQGIFKFTQLPVFNNNSSFDAFLLAGIGLMRFNTRVDAADQFKAIYDFSALQYLERETKAQTLASLSTLMDGDYETITNEHPLTTPLYQMGGGISWKIKDNISVSMTHRVSIAGTDNLDSYRWDKNNQENGTNDLQYFTSIGLSYSLAKREKAPESEEILPLPPLVEVVVPSIKLDAPSIEVEIPSIELETIVLTEEEKEVVQQAFDHLEFETNLNVIQSVSFSSLDELADLLLANPNWKLKITGHTDNIGSPESNLELSRRRAEAVRDYLTARKIALGRFIVLWYGETQPIADNSSEAGRQRNRRVEMEIVE